METSPAHKAGATIGPYISQHFIKVTGTDRTNMHAALHINTSIEQALQTMTQLNTEALPVLDEQQHLVGMITRSRLLSILYEHQNTLLLKHKQEHSQQMAINKTLNNDLIRANAEIIRMKDRDLLTDQMSYTLVQEMIDHIINAPMTTGLLAVVCLAVDNFRWINALYGMPVGDSILKEIAIRVRQACTDKDILTRQRGDEFIIILPERTSLSRVHQEIKKIVQAVTRPFVMSSNTVSITSSSGVSLFPQDAQTSTDLLKKSNIAMHQAKIIGKNNIQYFTRKMGERAWYENTIREQLHTALDHQEFYIAYQPLFDSRTLRVTAVEALLRWNNPVLGLISPVDFIPFVEDMGLISRIGSWVLEEACRQARHWQTHHHPVRVCVNISTRQFQPFKSNGGKFIKIIQTALKKSGLSPELLELEITESTLMQENTLTLNTLKKIVALGVHLSCDDFGTGYSSFHRLQLIPLNTLKIDKSLIDNIHKNTVDITIVRAILHIATQLHMQTVAEGVEHTQQARILRDMGCNLIQGFYFEKPMSSDELDLMLSQMPH